MKKRVLFVDDEPMVLQGLRRTLRGMRSEWDMVFVESGQRALESLGENRVDAIVTDMRMPSMNGGQLLEQVSHKYPEVVRIILSGQSDQEATLNNSASNHIYLSKPCDVEYLKCAVYRGCNLRDALTSDGIRSVLPRLAPLPELSPVYTRISEIAHRADVSMVQVAKIASEDPSLSAHLVETANCSSRTGPDAVSDIESAVSLLGIETTKSLALSCSALMHWDGAEVPFSLDSLWSHSLQVAAHARDIASCERVRRADMEIIVTAAMLHDVGKVLLGVSFPDKYTKVIDLAKQKEIPSLEAEKQIIGATHGEVGAYLSEQWGLGNAISEALAFHDEPRKCLSRDLSAVVIVHVANALAQQGGSTWEGLSPAELDDSVLSELGLSERLPLWREACDRHQTAGAAR